MLYEICACCIPVSQIISFPHPRRREIHGAGRWAPEATLLILMPPTFIVSTDFPPPQFSLLSFARQFFSHVLFLRFNGLCTFEILVFFKKIFRRVFSCSWYASRLLFHLDTCERCRTQDEFDYCTPVGVFVGTTVRIHVLSFLFYLYCLLGRDYVPRRVWQS